MTRDLISKTKEYSVSNAAKGYLPAFSVNGQATYQSAVTTFPFTIPIKGFTLPNYSKDQYKIFGQLDQVVYDGGVIKNQQQTAEGEKAGHHYRIGHNIIFRYLFTPYRRNGRRK